MLNLENRLVKLGFGAKTYNWKEVGDENFDGEEILLSNTFINSKSLPIMDENPLSDKEKIDKLIWVD